VNSLNLRVNPTGSVSSGQLPGNHERLVPLQPEEAKSTVLIGQSFPRAAVSALRWTDVLAAGGFSSSGRTRRKRPSCRQREMWGGRSMSEWKYSANVLCLVSGDFWLSSHRHAEDTGRYLRNNNNNNNNWRTDFIQTPLDSAGEKSKFFSLS